MDKVDRYSTQQMIQRDLEDGNIERAYRETKELIDDVKETIDDKKKANEIEQYLTELRNKGKKRAEEISDFSADDLVVTVSRKYVGYAQLLNWWIGELNNYLEEVLTENDLIPKGTEG